jgi:hypothetical protein
MAPRQPRHHPDLQTLHRLPRVRKKLRVAKNHQLKHFQQPSPAPWAEAIPLPAQYPALSKDSQPTLVKASQLPELKNYKSPKPVVAADASGNVAVVSYGVVDDPMGSDILLWRSGDRGVSWRQPENLTNSAKAGGVNFDPWLECDGDCRFYLVYGQKRQGNPIIRRSKDSAKSWSESLQIPWKSCDRPVLGISPNRKTLVVAAAMAEKSANYPTEPLDENDPKLQEKVRAAFISYAGVFVSSDHGSTWEKWTSPFGDQHAIPFAVVVDNANRVAASWVVEGDGSRSAVSVSQDGGQTWTNTTLVKSLQPDRSHPFNGERFPVVALDGSYGLHVAFVTAGAQKLLIQSSADWKTWKDGSLLSNDSIDEVRMAAIDGCGPMVHVTWMERTGNIWQAYYRGSRDSGETWSPALCLSQGIVLSDASIANGFQIYGDDDQSSVRDDGLGRVHAIWSFRGGRIAHAIVDWSSPG